MAITPQEALQRTIDHREIFYDEMLSLMRQIMNGELSPVMTAAILSNHRRVPPFVTGDGDLIADPRIVEVGQEHGISHDAPLERSGSRRTRPALVSRPAALGVAAYSPRSPWSFSTSPVWLELARSYWFIV